ncbi:MAG: hypothetical protein AB1411_07545 [Nitrospirota bacterium]
MTRRIAFWLVFAILCGGTSAWAEDEPARLLQVGAEETEQAIVQIGGRMCEYRRSEVEDALRRFDAVRQVQFLNNHGTVLVRFLGSGVRPERLAQAVERALIMGWGCKAWVDEGAGLAAGAG